MARSKLSLLERTRALAPLLLILGLAFLLRLNNVGFGLPSLYDPDEPLFMVKAAGLLKEHSLNPHWFGHPATTTLYVTALVQAGVFLSGVIAGRFSSIADFVHAAYANPAIIWIPVRVAMVVLGTINVGLTYLLGKRLFGRSVGLLAALLLALNALHIGWSQVVRSDIQESDFMLAALLVACHLADTGRLKHAVWTGLLTGFAIATKWPAVSVFAGAIGAAMLSAISGGEGVAFAAVKRIAAAGLATLTGMFIASPFLFIDYPTVISNLQGEARPLHVGHTGHGFLSNLGVYIGGFGVNSMGWLGIGLALVGVIVTARSSPKSRWILVPALIAFFISIAAPHLVWSRWLIPGLPYLAIFAAAAVAWLAGLITRGRNERERVVLAALGLIALVPSAAGAIGQDRERRTDTRTQAAEWVIAHVPAGSTVVLEHPQLNLLRQPERFLFPMGSRGCQDARNLLSSNTNDRDLSAARGGSAVVDLGSVAPAKAATCRGDYIVLSYYDLYLHDAALFPTEIATYRAILAGGRTVAVFRPRAGSIGGPMIRIVALPQNIAAR